MATSASDLKTTIYFLLPEGVHYEPGKSTYDAGFAAGVDFSSIPASRLVEVTSGNAHQFIPFKGRTWDDDNGKMPCEILLAYHTEELKHVGLAAFALSKIPVGSEFNYGGDLVKSEKAQGPEHADFVKATADTVVTPHKKCNFTLFCQYAPEPALQKVYQLPAGDSLSNYAWANCLAISDVVSVSITVTSEILPGELVAWDYNVGSMRKTYWEYAMLYSPSKVDMAYFGPTGLPKELSFKPGSYAPMGLLVLGNGSSRHLFGEMTYYDVRFSTQLNAQLRYKEDRVPAELFFGGVSLNASEIKAKGDAAVRHGQFCFKLTALLTHPTILSMTPETLFEGIKSNHRFFKAGPFIRSVMGLEGKEKVTMPKLTQRLYQAVIEDDFDTLGVLLAQYGSIPGALQKILNAKLGDDIVETLLEATVRLHRGNMYSVICSAYAKIVLSGKATETLSIPTGPLEGTLASGLTESNIRRDLALWDFFKHAPSDSGPTRVESSLKMAGAGDVTYSLE